MPKRFLVFANREVYHIYNRSIGKAAIFFQEGARKRALELIRYYRLENPPVSFSYFIRLFPDYIKELQDLEKTKNFKVQILAFCLMPNHFHFLITQLKEGGISEFIGNFSNGFAKYFNIANERKGPLFEGAFKAVHMESEDQLVHVSRYIHLNPYAAALVKELSELKTYPLTSLPEYLKPNKAVIINPHQLLTSFHNNPYEYWQFVSDRADYQRELEEMKHLLEE